MAKALVEMIFATDRSIDYNLQPPQKPSVSKRKPCINPKRRLAITPNSTEKTKREQHGRRVGAISDVAT